MRVLREPLFHFLILGGLILLGVRQFDAGNDRYRIDAGPSRQARLAATYLQQYGVAPTPAQLASLVQQYVRSEVLFREGIALGLDQGDEIVRRRVIQKLEFITQDAAVDKEASQLELERFFRAHEHLYEVPATVSFTQLYFSPDDKGSDHARQRAEDALRAIRRTESSAAAADAPADESSVRAIDSSRAKQLFGESSLTEALFRIPKETWSGPYQSGLGWHLVRVTERTEPRPARLEDVRSTVAADLQLSVQQTNNAEEFRRLASKYRIATTSATS